MWEYEKVGAQSVKKPLLIIIKGHYNDRFLWLTLPEIDYLCDQWNRPPDQPRNGSQPGLPFLRVWTVPSKANWWDGGDEGKPKAKILSWFYLMLLSSSVAEVSCMRM